MFAELLALALAGQQITIPLGKTPRQIERPRAPIEQSGPLWAATCKDWDDWDKPAPPVRIHANTYLVGTCGIAAILVAGDEGHVLIDSGTEAGADLVAANIRALGFRLQDVRFILTSHEHHDHVGGVARLLQLTGATLVTSESAARVFTTGTADPADPQAGLHGPFPAATAGRIVKHGDRVRLFDIELTAVATPGHTPGRIELALGKLRRRCLPDDGFRRQPFRRQPRRLQVHCPPRACRRLPRFLCEDCRQPVRHRHVPPPVGHGDA